jgi:cytochrome c oxidase subunit 1
MDLELYQSKTRQKKEAIKQLNAQRYSFAWIEIALLSLSLSGLFALSIVFMRMPFFKDYIDVDKYFKIHLICHVNLSVFIWLTSIGLSIISYGISDFTQQISSSIRNACISGIASIILSCFLLDAYPVINNYIPIIINPYFVAGLGTFTLISFKCAFASLIFLIKNKIKTLEDFMYLTLSINLCISFIILIQGIFYVYDPDIKTGAIINDYLEKLFFGFGHSMQFFYTQIAIVIWYFLWTRYYGYSNFIHNTSVISLLVNVIVLLPSIMFTNDANINSGLYFELFTNHMIIAGGIAPMLFILSLLIYYFYYKPDKISDHNNLYFISLVCSIILFLIGGLMGLLSSFGDVTIPAHYHGSTVSITIASMAFVYSIFHIFLFNFDKLRIASFQIISYTAGQSMHIFGLFMSGGYGVMRKDPKSALIGMQKFYMGIMGLGGLISILSGLLFVIIIAKFIFKHKKALKSSYKNLVKSATV